MTFYKGVKHIIRDILQKVLGYNRRMENRQAIEDQIKELNSKEKIGKWDEIRGFHTSLSVVIESDKSQTVDSSRGMTIKLFLNLKTGEIKVYTAEKFLK